MNTKSSQINTINQMYFQRIAQAIILIIVMLINNFENNKYITLILGISVPNQLVFQYKLLLKLFNFIIYNNSQQIYQMGNNCLDNKLKDDIYQQDNLLQVKIKTWIKQAHHLFDYSTQMIKQQFIIIQENAMIVKYQNNFKCITQYQQFKHLDKKKIQFSIDVSKYDNYFMIMKSLPNDNGQNRNNIWQVINENQKIQIQLNDIFKLGRVRFKLSQIILHQNQINPAKQNQKLQNQNICKICYEKHITEDNPLISPCGCTGSLQYIHLGCLKLWLEMLNDIKKTQHSIQIIVKEHKCPLCKKCIDESITYQKKSYKSYHRKDLSTPYIKLQLFVKDENKSKHMYYFSFKNVSEIYIGRASSAQIRINDDISISRQHSLITFSNGKFYLSDLKSKFGTLKLIRNSIKCQQNGQEEKQLVQINNHIFQMRIKGRNSKPNYIQRKKTEQELIRMLQQNKLINKSDQIQSIMLEESLMNLQNQQS